MVLTMQYVIEGFKPTTLFKYFEEISAIPRSSGNEKAISEFLISFAKERGLEFYTDELHDVIIKKAGSLGKENNPPIILQGHTDMVCEKNSDTVHDFSQDGLKLKVENGILSAEGTTLGADNGVAVALMLAVLDDENLSHPPLECVFTVQEETGLFGASRLDESKLKGKTMINLDSEDEGVATVSCAGGMRVRFFKDAQWVNKSGTGIKINISGLSGGHSGTDIGKERANANKLMGRMLGYLAEDRVFFSFSQINGGNKDNAIPRECEAVILLKNQNEYDHAMALLSSYGSEIAEEIEQTDNNFKLNLSSCEVTRVMSENVTAVVGEILFLAPNGVLYRDAQTGFIVSSINMGMIKTADNGVTFTFLPRSSVASLQKLIRSELALFAGKGGFAMQIDSQYPGWKYEKTSHLREVFTQCYKEQTKTELKIEAIHAGLECGIFSQKIKGLDAIAVGPQVNNCHTPQECLDLHSCERFYKLLTGVLAKL